MLDGEILDPGRMNVVAAADHDVLQPSDDRQVAAVVEHAEVAGQEQAVAIERRLGGLLVVDVAEHQTRHAAAALTDRTARLIPARLVLPEDHHTRTAAPPTV